MVRGISTRSKVSKTGLGFGLCLSLMVFGCATTTSLGEQMIGQGQSGMEIGQQWNAGQELLRKGEKMVARGEDSIADGKKSIRNGEDDVHEGQQMVDQGRELIAQGRAQMRASEATYQSQFPGASQQLSPAR